jgi:hypothetical protein
MLSPREARREKMVAEVFRRIHLSPEYRKQVEAYVDMLLDAGRELRLHEGRNPIKELRTLANI